jgi:Phage integrase family
LRPIRLHDLRHTAATLLKDLGVPARDTMDILGHSRIAVTMEVYTGADDARRSRSSARCSEVIPSDRCCHFCCHSGRTTGNGAGGMALTWWAVLDLNQ